MNYAAVNDEKIIVASNMIKFGGSFVKALGEALMHADIFNVMRIEEAFPEIWKEYKNWGK